MAFSDCSGLEGNLVIPDKVQWISNRAFYNCTGWKGNLIVGKNVTSLGEYTFVKYVHNSALVSLNFTKVYFKGVTPPPSAYKAFAGDRLRYVAVPIGCKDAYRKAFSNNIDVIEEIEF